MKREACGVALFLMIGFSSPAHGATEPAAPPVNDAGSPAGSGERSALRAELFSVQDASTGLRSLSGHIPHQAVTTGLLSGPTAAATRIDLALTLRLHDPAGLTTLLDHLYDQSHPLAGQYLSPAEFVARFSPSQDEYRQVATFAEGHGLTVTGTHPNRTLLDVRGTAASVEAAFGVQLVDYRSPAGRLFHAPDREPLVPESLSGFLSGVVGLDNSNQLVAHPQRIAPRRAAARGPIGTGPLGGLSPRDLRVAYDLVGVEATGAGQTLGLFELDGYTPSDITAYETRFGLPAVPLQNVLVDGFSGIPGVGANEVTADIQVQAAIAPGAAKIIVYEGPNTFAGLVDAYNRIATDNLAKSISTSWGLFEKGFAQSVLDSENTIFKQMAAQGQTIFSAAGDHGAFDDLAHVTARDPATQPYMCAVGGTTLTTGPGGCYASETTWNHGSAAQGAGGGGISTVWPIPAYQDHIVSVASMGSTTMRNEPDVALVADPDTGYSIYLDGKWILLGGTSLAAPVWAAFAARVNDQRTRRHLPPVGFINPHLYRIARTPRYRRDFHDIEDGSTNLLYPAVKGYDLATGLGSFIGRNLFEDLSFPAQAQPND